MRTSTTVDGAPGGVRLKRNVSPCLTPAGTRTLTAWAAATSPTPAQVTHHSFHTSPRPPQREQVRRSGTSNGMVTPENASRGVKVISADSVIAGSAVKNASRMRSRTLATEGKSIATSSENQVCALGALARQRAVVLTSARRIAQDVVGASQLLERQTAIVSGDVRVIAARKLPVGALDFIRAGIRRYAEDIVVVTHTRAPSPAERVPPFTPEVNDGATIREG